MVTIDLDNVKLEKEVNEEINKNISIKFDDKTQKESIYMQKYAEGRLIDLGGEFNLIILVTTVAMSLGITFIYLRNLIEFLEYTIGFILLLGGVYWIYNLKPRYKRCHKIILDAEKRILSEGNIVSKPQQETPLKQENVEPITETKEIKHKDIDPRTVYSLSMTVILYELYKSDFFTRQDSLMPLLKNIVLALLIGQVLFLFVKGFSFAGISELNQKWLSELSDSIYAFSFHSSVIFFVLGVILFATTNIFIVFNIPIIIWTKMFLILINLGIAIGLVYIWKRHFFKNNNQNTNMAIYFSVILWSIIMTLIFSLLK